MEMKKEKLLFYLLYIEGLSSVKNIKKMLSVPKSASIFCVSLDQSFSLGERIRASNTRQSSVIRRNNRIFQ